MNQPIFDQLLIELANEIKEMKHPSFRRRVQARVALIKQTGKTWLWISENTGLSINELRALMKGVK